MSHKPGEFRQKIISFDYDGTLHPPVWPNHGTPYPHMVTLVEKLKAQGYRVCINTARDSLAVPEIVANTGIAEVHTGKPIADLYLDDRSLLPREGLIETVIDLWFTKLDDYLAELTTGALSSAYARNIANDRAAGGPEEQNDVNFRLVIPLTGGMDSTTLWQMGLESGLPLHPVYLRMGQEYADAELKVATDLAGVTGHQLEILDVEMPFVRHDFLMLGRNAVILFTLAELMRQRGQWGEIWFGNYGSESPVLGGDKSRRFLNDTQALLDLRGYDVRISSPLIGMDKADEVGFWKTRDIETLIGTKSCFHPTLHACGECQPCFKKWVAFMAHDIDIRDHFARTDLRVSFDRYVRKYKDVMGRARAVGDYSHYSPRRIELTLSAIKMLEVHW